MKPIIQYVAAKALIRNDSQILLLREAATDADGTQVGRYQVPGGRIEPGESFFDGLRREIREETGLSVTIGQPIFVCEWQPVIRNQPHHIVALFMECHADSDAVTLSHEHDALAWVDAHTIQDYPLIASEEPQLVRYVQSL